MTRMWYGKAMALFLTVVAALALGACDSAAGGEDPGGGGSGGGGGGGSGGGGGIVARKDAKLEFRPEGGRYTINLAEVAVGEETTRDVRIINSGEKDLVIETLAWAYTMQAPDAEADKPAFSCTYGPDRIPCDDDSGLPYTVALLNSGTDTPEELILHIQFFRYEDDVTRDAAVTIQSNDPDNDGKVTAEFVTGQSIPRIQATPERVVFTDLRKGEAQSKYLTVLNSGSAKLRIDKFTLSAAQEFTVRFNNTDYVSSEDTRSGVSLDPPLELDPNSALDVEIIYLPEDANNRDGTLQIHSNDPEQDWTVVYLEAQQSGPGIDVLPRRIEFGPRIVGRESALELQILSKGSEPVQITSIAFDETSSQDFSVRTDEIMTNGEPISAENPLIIPPNDFRTLKVYFSPDTLNDVDEVTGSPVLDTGLLVILNDSFEDRVELETSGYGVQQDCPVGVIVVEEGDEVIPQTNLHLVGDQSFAMVGQVRRWEWRVDQPIGSQGVFVPSPTFPNPTFEANVAGTYTFYLDVWDEEDVKSCEPATYEVVVIPDEAIHIELLWTTPGDPDETDTGPFAGSDVDLHFIHPNAPSDPVFAPDLDGDGEKDPYFDQPYDCYWFNPHPDWSSFGNQNDDDPGLDRDDTDGAGPENVNLNVPENGKTYEVAIHYWADHSYGASFVTVRVYIYQVLVFELSNVRLTNYDLWCVAFVDWPSGQVHLCEAPGGGYRITPNYQHPMFFGD